MVERFLPIPILERIATTDPLTQNRLAAIRALQESRYERRQHLANLCQIASLPIAMLALIVALIHV